jgi:hypothetical protein
MGAGQSDTSDLDGGFGSDHLAPGSHATHAQLVEALAQIERSAERAQLREAFLTETSRIDQLLAFVKSKPFATIVASGGYEMNSHGHYGMGDTLRAPALRVLIALTNSNTKAATGGEIAAVGLGRFEEERDKDKDKVQDTSSSASSSSLWFQCAGGRTDADSSDLDERPGELKETTRVASMVQIEAQEQQRIRLYLVNMIGKGKIIQYLLLLALSKEPPEVGGLAVQLLANLADGGGDRVRCTIASMPLRPLVHHARAHNMLLDDEFGEAEERNATSAFVVLGHMLEHALSHKDRQRGRDLLTGEEFRTQNERDDMSMLMSMTKSAKRLKNAAIAGATGGSNGGGDGGDNGGDNGSGNGDGDGGGGSGGGADRSNFNVKGSVDDQSGSLSPAMMGGFTSAPYNDVLELRVHQRLLSIGLIPAIGKQIAFGIPSTRLLKAMVRCIFNMVSGKNLLIMETDMDAKQRVVDLRSDTLRYNLSLEYSEELEYSMLVSSALLKTTNILDMLLWCVIIDVKEPPWASTLHNPTKRMPYPWNIRRALFSCPSLRTDAMAALSSLTSSFSSRSDFRPLLGQSLVMPFASRHLLDLGMKHNSTGDGSVNNTRRGGGEDDPSPPPPPPPPPPPSSLSSSDYSSSEPSSAADSDDSGNDNDDDDDDNDGTLSDESGHTSSDADDGDVNFLQNVIVDGSHHAKDTNHQEDNSLKTQQQVKVQKKQAGKTRRSTRKGRVKRYSVVAIDDLLGTLEKFKKQRRSVWQVTRMLTQGIKKKWQCKVIEKAIRSRRSVAKVDDSNLSSAGLIASVRRLAHKDETSIRHVLRARRNLKESIFSRVMETFAVELESSHTNAGRVSHVTIKPAKQKSESRWRALQHSIVRGSKLNADKYKTEAFTERIYYTVSTYNDPHNLAPLWELLPPEPLMKLMGEKASYTIAFDKNAPGGIGIAFSMTMDLSSGHGVAISSIAPGTQADRAKVAGLAVGDLLLYINGENVRGAKWTTKRVERVMKDSPNPLRLTLLGWKTQQFLDTLRNKCATRRWFQGCDDSIWVEPAETIFRVVRVLVKHRQDIEAFDLVNGNAVPLFAGSGLLTDSLATLDGAYIVNMSEVTEHSVYNRCSLMLNKFRVYKRLEKAALRTIIDTVIHDMFERGLAPDIRRRDQHDFLKSWDKKESRLGVVFRCLVTPVTASGVKLPDLARYHAAEMILQLFSSSWRAHERSQSLSLLDMFNALGSGALAEKGETRTHQSVSEEELTKLFTCAIRDSSVGIRGYTTVMHVADLCQK